MVKRWRTVLLGAALAAAGAAAAQQATIDASVDRPVIHDNESFTYTIRAEGSVRGEPELGAIKQQFDVLASSSEKRIGIVNGRTSEVTTWTYELMPKRAGEFTLPQVRVGALQTNTVTLRVTPPPAATSAAPADVFIELEAQPSTVYVQSQVVVTLRLFVGVSTGRATLTQPEIGGGEAIVEKLGEDTNYSTERAGRAFSVRERRYAIFPQAAGTLTVGPATFEAMVIPDRGFSRVSRFRSSTLELAVQPAVPPPASMAGAAWLPAQRVKLTERWNDDSAELTVGIPRTRQITIEADGLLETQLPELALPQPQGLRQYADQPDLSHELTPLGIKSKRTVSMAVIAQAPGAITLPKLALPWWNVKTQAWEVAELPERNFKIAPSAEAPAPVAQAESAPAPAAAAPTSALWPLVSAGLALGWLATVLVWWRSVAGRAARAPGRRASASGSAERRPNERRLLRDAQAACAASDADAARRALLAWAEARFADAPRSLGALASELAEPAAGEILALEALIYGATPGSWDGRALAAALNDLDTAARAATAAGKDEPLLPLYR
ncbi:MAG TPA: BatD family protein [Gammaproteobacteria bacterium]|nr:BatD family protein [Gammaproteobacteria bacterium]